MSDRILLIEDDPRLAAMVGEYLGEAGYRVLHARNGAQGLAMEARESCDALILDLMLPDMDGLDVCRQIRARSETPMLMLTARGDAMDRVIGLEMGADDYLPKPFEPRELLARLRAILRRGRLLTAARGGPAENALHPGEQLAQMERLRQVVVGAHLEADDAVHGLAAAGQDDDSDARFLAERTSKGQSVLAGQH